jgi:hypothetical protein
MSAESAGPTRWSARAGAFSLSALVRHAEEQPREEEGSLAVPLP